MSTTLSEAESFNTWRAYLWPVHRYELKKLLPMLGIFFLITFNYNILRILKETLVVHAKGSGAEAIPFIKVWAMFPGAILMTLFFTYLSNRMSRESVFYTITGIFIGYFALYILFLYPFRDTLHPDNAADYLAQVLPVGCSGFVAMIRNWTATSFYAMAELWGNIVLFVLFWGFANQITRLHEAKRFYGLFGIGANFSGIVAGQVAVAICRGDYNPALPFGSTAWEQSLVMLVTLVVGAGLAALALFYWMQTRVLTDPRFYDQTEQVTSKGKEASKEEKPKFSLGDTFAFLMRSRYVLCIAIIVFCYNAVINFSEVLWKHEVKELYSDPNAYNLYMNQVSSVIGLFATLASLFIAGNSIRCLGWTFTALLTPVILLVTSIGFFTFFFLKDSTSDVILAALGMSPLAMVVFFGSAQNILSRAAKYSVFDATKEMAFIPLDADAKLKSKAAIDGIGSRLGKSGGAVVYQILLVFFGSLTAGAPYIAVFLLGVIVVWSIATYSLGQQFVELTAPPVADEVKNQFSAEEITQPQASADVKPLFRPSSSLLPEQQAV
jgi:AAA family ATP:ADP antiporter